MTATGHHNPPPIRATLLGKARISVGDRLIGDDAWSLRSARSLLLLLLITPGHAISRERVCDLLWPEASPEVARNALYKALHLLRRVLEPELVSARESAYIETRGGTIGIVAAVDVEVDAEAFETALTRAMLAPADERRSQLRKAVSLYGGELLPTDRYEDWPVARREALRFAWEGAVLDLAELDLAAGEPQASVPSLELLISIDPAIEAAHRALMRGYIAAGQRDRAMRQYERCVTALATELGVEPDAETRSLYAGLRDADEGAAGEPRLAAQPFNNLPASPTAIIGRDREIDTLQGTLWRQDIRLVTLIGPGGVGKTRLAIEVASHLARDLADGVAFVSLTAVRDPRLVLPTIASTLGIKEDPAHTVDATLAAHLRPREMLLVLDNFEQVLDAAPGVGALLASCPSLTVLATSRERLQVRGEWLHEVTPLAVPRPERLPAPAVLARYGSVALFVQQMQQIDPAFKVTAENSEVVSAICRHLEGLPLAIELATARARFFTLGGLLARLTHRLDIEEGPRDLPARQRTLRATFAWSHDLLSLGEQTVFRRLGVAVGGCTLDAAEAICGNHDSRLPAHLRSLAEKHLVRWTETDDGPRISMLETIREFALERLRESGEEEEFQHRHAEHFLTQAVRAEERLVGAEQLAWFARLETDQDNIRAALAWGLPQAGDAGTLAVRGAVALWRFWQRRHSLREGIDWLERALARPGTDPQLRFRGLLALARMHEAQSGYERAEALVDEALPICRQAGDEVGVADALDILGQIAEDRAQFDRASEQYRQALAIYRANRCRRESAGSLNKLGIVAYYQNDIDGAQRLWEDALAIYRELSDHWSTGVLLGNLGIAAMTTGDFERAVALHEENLAIARQLNDKGTIGRELYNLAEALQYRGDGDQDVLLTEALDLHREASDRQAEACTLALMAHNALGRGLPHRAASLYGDGLSLCLTTGDRATLANAALLEGTSAVALASAQAAPAARLLGAAEALREEIGAPITTYLRPVRDRSLERIGAVMESGALAAAMREGRALSTGEAIRAALAVCERAQRAAPPTPIHQRGSQPPAASRTTSS